jgi:hypothetical protein
MTILPTPDPKYATDSPDYPRWHTLQVTKPEGSHIAALSFSQHHKQQETQMTQTLTRPADLDVTRLHSPVEVDMWKAEWHAYRETLRAEEKRERLNQQAKEAYENRLLTRDEYHALSVQREAEKQGRQAARQAAAKAKADEEAAYLASLPEVAEVCEQSDYLFLLRLQHWMAQGYTVAEDSIQAFQLGSYWVRLNKPVFIGQRSN